MNALLAIALHLAALLESNPPLVLVVKDKDSSGIGAAVIVDARGFAVTCQHVVGRRSQVIVGFREGTFLPAAVVARQPENDLALLKLPGPWRYVPVALADGPPRVRDPVLAWGHPKGYSWTMTSGTVTALGRTIKLPDGDPVAGVLQTDAAINGGNSGGLLMNARGELVGVPLAIHEGSAGIAFAVPVGTVRKFLAEHLPPR